MSSVFNPSTSNLYHLPHFWQIPSQIYWLHKALQSEYVEFSFFFLAIFGACCCWSWSYALQIRIPSGPYIHSGSYGADTILVCGCSSPVAFFANLGVSEDKRLYGWCQTRPTDLINLPNKCTYTLQILYISTCYQSRAVSSSVSSSSSDISPYRRACPTKTA